MTEQTNLCGDEDLLHIPCTHAATWLMTSQRKGEESTQTKLCDRHKDINARVAEKLPDGYLTVSFTPLAGEIKPPKLFDIPAGTPAAKCTKCGGEIFWVGKQPLRALVDCRYRHKGNVTLLKVPDATPPTATSDGKGFNHFIDCPNAGEFRK